MHSSRASRLSASLQEPMAKDRGDTHGHVEDRGNTDKQSEGRGSADTNPQPEPHTSLQEPVAKDRRHRQAC